MDNIIHWLTTPPAGVDMVFWVCALVSTLIFVILAVLSLVGMDGHDVDMDFDADADGDVGDSIPIFSVHSVVNFILGFGWTGVVAAKSIESKPLLYLAGVIVGIIFAGVYIFIYKKMKKLEHNGAYKIQDCVGKTASVYLRIPAAGEGKGKVQVSINGSIHEFDAVSTSEPIPTGATIQILSVEGTVLTVEKK